MGTHSPFVTSCTRLISWFVALFLFETSLLAGPTCLGDDKADDYWIYFHGLDTPAVGAHERENRALLKKLAKKLNIRIGVARSQDTCKKGQLCWLHTTSQWVEKSVDFAAKSLRSCQGQRNLKGFIGFSNGAYLVSKYFQLCRKKMQVIAIGGGGILADTAAKKSLGKAFDWSQCGNLLFLMGQKDISLGDVRKKVSPFQNDSFADKYVGFQTFAGGHELPKDFLENILRLPSVTTRQP